MKTTSKMIRGRRYFIVGHSIFTEMDMVRALERYKKMKKYL